MEAVLGIKSSFKRTPKYRIESKKDNLKERMKYSLPLDRMSFLELFMGVYSLVLIYFAISSGRSFILPFLLLYASGFLMDFLYLPASSAARGTVRLPGSKSISNRVLLLAALAKGSTIVRALLDSDDTRVMLDALRTLGVGVARVK